MEQTKKIVGKTNRIRSLVLLTVRVFVTFVLLVNATFILWHGEGIIAMIEDPTALRFVNVETDESIGYALESF